MPMPCNKQEKKFYKWLQKKATFHYVHLSIHLILLYAILPVMLAADVFAAAKIFCSNADDSIYWLKVLFSLLKIKSKNFF